VGIYSRRRDNQAKGAGLIHRFRCPLYADPSITRADSAIVIINLSFRRTITTFFPVSNVLFHKKAATLLALDDCRAALFY
jgi:hypothetical protein